MVKKSIDERLSKIDDEIYKLEQQRKDYVNIQNEGNKKRYIFDWLSGVGMFTATCGFFLLFLNLIAGLCVLGVGAISGYAFSAFSEKHKKIAKDVQFNIETCNAKMEELKKDKSSLIKEQEIELAEYKEYILYGKQPVISNNKKQKTQIQEQYKNDDDLSM